MRLGDPTRSPEICHPCWPRVRFLAPAFATTLFLVLASGCASKSRPFLGENVTIAPGWSRLMQSGKQALRDPNVWGSLLAATALQVGDLDEQISDQLREDTPLFGSTRDARNYSDDLKDLNQVAYIATALAAPGADAVGEWLGSKAKLVGTEWLAVELAGEFTTGIQHYSGREKPNEKNDNGFPSYHTSTATMSAQMANLNVEYLPVSSQSKQALTYTFNSIAALTAWARVEAGEHYPSDVLAGWALGHFLGYLAEDFIAPDQDQLRISTQISGDSIGVGMEFRF